MDTISLADALFTKTQQKVLGLMFGRPETSFYLNEIVRMAGMGKGTITRELEKLQTAGVLSVRRIGNQNHFQANKESPIYPELLAIVRKTFGTADEIRNVLTPLNDRIRLAFVYGSVAKGEATVKSDIDLMVIADDLSYADLIGVLTTAEKSLGRPIHPTLYDQDEFREKLHNDNAFITRVLNRPKLWVIGSESDIGKPR